MSTAEELLTSAHIHTHPVPDTDTYFVIDPITRRIENTNRKKSVIMQYDHNSERFTFQLPRYVDGHDMMECTSVTVNADNIETETGTTNSDAPDMTDLRPNPDDPETVISSWSISRNLTQLAGILSFSIEYKCVDAEGNVVYEWSTDTFDEIEVRARKKNGEAAVIEHTDLLEQWRAQIFGAGDSVMANIAAEGETQVAAVNSEGVTQVAAVKMESESQQEVIELKGMETSESIPEDYTETNNMADEAIRTKSDAIICEAAGETIVLTNSSDDYIRGLKVCGKSTQKTTTGKNLIPRTTPKTANGIVMTVSDDGTITLNGTATGNAFSQVINCNIPAGNYVFSANNPIAIGTDSTNSPYVAMRDAGLGWYLNAIFTTTNFTKAVSFGADQATVLIAIPEGVTVNNFTLRLQLEEGSVATEYEPYTGGIPSPNPDYPQEIKSVENATVEVCGKNLFDVTVASRTVNGVTFTINEDKSVTMNGTATKTTYFILGNFILGNGEYYLSGCKNGGPNYVLYFQRTHDFSGYTQITTNEIKFTIDDSDKRTMFIAAYEGHTLSNETVYPMIRSAAISDDTYEPYKPAQTLSITQTLPGIHVTSGDNYTDSDGRQWICDEIDLERGVYIQRVGTVTFNGTETWQTYSKGSIIHAFRKKVNDLWSKTNSYTAHQYRLWSNYFQYGGYICEKLTTGIGLSEAQYIYLRLDGANDNITTLDELYTWLAEKNASGDPVMVKYPLDNPIETPLTAEEITAFKSLRTNYPNTTILNDAGAWMSVKYNADTKTYVENPKVLKLVDSSTGVVYELKIVDGNITVTPV